MLTLIILCSIGIGNAWGDVTDEITVSDLTATNTTYTNFSNVAETSSARYAGNTAKGNSVIQLRASSSCGIVSTTSGGVIKSVTITWDGNTTDGRYIEVYGSNTAYSGSSDLYDNSKKGVLLGTIAKNVTTPLSVVGDFKYIGLKSSGTNTFITKFSITWTDADDPLDYVYNLVTDVSDLAAGDRVIILNTGGTYAMSTTQNTNNRAGVAAAANNWSITADKNTVTLGASTTVEVMTVGRLNNHWIFVTGTGYLRAAGNTTSYWLKTNTSTDTYCEWGISLNGSNEASIIGQGDNTNKTMQFNSSLFSCYATAAYTAIKIYKQEPPSYTVTWAAGSEEEFYTQTDVAGTALEDPGTPTAGTYCPGGKVFVGWTETPIAGEDDDAPADLFTSVGGKSIQEGGTTYYAVFATSSGGGGASGYITLTRTTTNFPSSYGTANTFTEYTLAGYKFKIQQIYNNSTTGQKGSQTMQWRGGGNSNGSGTIYNTQKFPANISSIVIVYASDDGNKNISLNVGASENPTSGTAISTPTITSTYTYTFDCSGGSYDYFVLTNGSGAGYVESITINYGSSTTYSAYATSCVVACAGPTAATKGSFNSGTQKMPINWTSAAGKVDICYSTSSTKPDATPSASYTVVSNQTSSPVNLDVSGLSAGNYYCWVRSVCDADSKSVWTAISDDYFTVPGYTLTITADPSATGTFDQTSGQTVVVGRTVSITATPASGYNFTSWAVSGTGSTLSSTSTNPTTFTMGTANATVTATFTAKEVTGWTWKQQSTGETEITIPDVVDLYVGQQAWFNLKSYTPADVIAGKKGYSSSYTNTYLAEDNKAGTYYKTRAKAVTESTTLTLTSSSNSSVTQEITIRIKALPSVTFTDIIHGETFGAVTATVDATDKRVVYTTKKTPTHDDLDEPGSGNDCEKQHLHLAGWILKDWADLHPDATSSEISGAGSGNFYSTNADIDLVAKNGKTFYAVWSKLE